MQRWSIYLAAAATLVFPLALLAKDAARHDTDALKQNFLAEHEIGRRYQFEADNLPPPKSGSIVTNRALTLAYTGQAPQVPPGFRPRHSRPVLPIHAVSWCFPMGTSWWRS